MANISTSNLIDQLGELKAQIADLENQKKVIEGRLKKRILPHGEGEGELFRVVRVIQNNTRVNWKGIAIKLKASKQLIESFTEHHDDKDFFKVSARRGLEKVA